MKLILKPGRLQEKIIFLVARAIEIGYSSNSVTRPKRRAALDEAEQSLLQVIRELGRECARIARDKDEVDEFMGLEVVEESDE